MKFTFKDIDEYLSEESSNPFLSNSSLRLHEILRRLRMKNLIQYASVQREMFISPLGWKILLNEKNSYKGNPYEKY